jgi:hypothetical protein
MREDQSSVKEESIGICKLRSGHRLVLITAFFRKVQWTKFTLTHEINHVPGEKAVGYSSVGKYLRGFICSSRHDDLSIVPESDVDFTGDDSIAFMLFEESFLVPHHVGKKVEITLRQTTVYRRVARSRGRELRCLKWILPKLTEHENATRVEKLNELSQLLQSLRHQG